MKLFTKSIMAVALSAVMGVAMAADVQKVSVKTGSGKDVTIVTQDDGTLAVFDGQNTLTGAAATSFLQSEGVTVTVSPTGVVMGLSFADGAGTVTEKPVFVSSEAQATAEAAEAAAATESKEGEATAEAAAESTETAAATESAAEATTEAATSTESASEASASASASSTESAASTATSTTTSSSSMSSSMSALPSNTTAASTSSSQTFNSETRSDMSEKNASN